MGRAWSSLVANGFGLPGFVAGVPALLSRCLDFGFDFDFDVRWWPLSLSVVDSVVWSFVTLIESVALVAIICFFFVFCGCDI